MKSLILSTIVALSALTGIAASASAESFQVHGIEGTHYGR